MVNLALIKDFAIIVGAPILRAVIGWAENSFKDGKIDLFEWKQLAETVLRLGMIGIAGYFGLNGLGIDISALGAAGSAIILDFLFRAIKK